MNQAVDKGFNDVVQLIVSARQKAVLAVNKALIDLYWQIGAVISKKIAAAEWGDGVVTQLAAHIAQTQPGLRGFMRPNLFRMRRFYEAYPGDAIVSPLVRQLPWTHKLLPAKVSAVPTQIQPQAKCVFIDASMDLMIAADTGVVA